MRRDLAVSVFLVVITFLAYESVVRHDFVNFDDDDYVYENADVRSGLTWEGVSWAFRSMRENNWHPLTWLSHMLDCQLFGMNAGSHHLVNLLLHVLNSVLLYMVLRRMTGALWRSATVAALFSLHPLHVESVAWIAERKDVLSTMFFMLTLWAYVRYAARPSWVRYGPVFLFFALGLTAKPMLVTLPFVLLLLDYWPLERFRPSATVAPSAMRDLSNNGESDRGADGMRLILEKLPLLGLAAASSVVTFVAQKRGGAMGLTDIVPVGDRIANALVSYVGYIGKMLWPRRLAVFYPYGETLPVVWGSAAVALLGVSILVVWASRRYRYLLVGWLWYLGILVPVIGLIQVGSQSMADRYTYVPLIGLFIMAVWGAVDMAAKGRHGRAALAVSAGVLILLCMVGTRYQIGHWRNSVTLFEHALQVTTENAIAHNNLGNALQSEGRSAEAIAHYQEALRINPQFVPAHNNLAVAFSRRGSHDQAITHLRAVLRIDPDSAPTHYNLGIVLVNQGKVEEAIRHYQEALRINPQFADAHFNLGRLLDDQGEVEKAVTHYQEALRVHGNKDGVQGNPRILPKAEELCNRGIVLARQGKEDEAIAHFRTALSLNSEYPQALGSLALALSRRGRMDEAIACYREAIRLNPDDSSSCNNLAWIRATHPDAEFRNGPEAVELGERASGLSPGKDPNLLDTLAAAYAEAGRFPEAIATMQEALALAKPLVSKEVVVQLERRLEGYRKGRPHRESPPEPERSGP